MFYTYVLKSAKDKKYYIGYTNDLSKRYLEHKKGFVISTKNRRPLILIYYEACLNEHDAKRREEYLKSGPGKKFLNCRMKSYLSGTDDFRGVAQLA